MTTDSKEAATGRFRAALETCGISTAPWWERQLDLCMIGIMATLGWKKALGDAGELGWGEARVGVAAGRCGIRARR